MSTDYAIDFADPCSWIPGSRAIPGTARKGRPPGDAPRNDDVSAFFRSLMGSPQLQRRVRRQAVNYSGALQVVE